jgi:hypothetical protein
MTAIDLRHIPFEAPEAEIRGKTLSQGEGNLSRLRTETLTAMELAPSCGFYHTEVIDEVASGRLRALLGLKPLEGQTTELFQRVVPGGWTMQQWREEILYILHHQSFEVENEFLCGSAAQYVANRRLLVRGLSILASNQVVRTAELYNELERRIRRITFGYQDVDVNIEVKKQLNNKLREALNQLPRPPGVIVEIKGPKHFYIISIKDKETKESLDFSIYKDRDNPYLITADSLRVVIPKEPGKDNLVKYDCPNLWNYWKAQVLRTADRSVDMKTDNYILPRLIDLETRKHRVTLWELEDHAFNQWWKWIEDQGPFVFFDRLKVIFEEHEPSPLGRQCQLLRWAQVLKAHQINGIKNYFKQLNRPELVNGSGQPFLYECLHMLHKGGLQTLELAGLVALQEGWKEPFSARIEFHEKKPMLRLRFRQEEIKRSLLLRYAPDETLAELNSQTLNWDKITNALHLLWKKPIHRRDQTDNFHKDRWVRTDLKGQIRAHFLKLTEASPSQAKLAWNTHSSLAAMMLPDLNSLGSLEKLADLLIDGKAGTDQERPELCWKIVDRLLIQHDYQTATRIILKLRDNKWDAGQGSVKLLIQLLSKHPKAPTDLLQACAPEGLTFNEGPITSQVVIKAADNPRLDASVYWQLIQELKVSPPSVSPEMLLRLQEVAPEKLWTLWVIRKWRDENLHTALCSAVSKRIIERAEEGIRTHFLQDKLWFFSFLSTSQRFVANDEERFLVFESLAAGICLEEQEKLLRNWNLQDSRAWNYLVQSYLQRDNKNLAVAFANFPPQLLQNWNHVLSYADADLAEQLLDGSLKDKEPPGGREAFTAALLARWKSCEYRTSFLKKLIPTAPWEIICKETEVERVLFELLKVGELVIGSHLLLSINPNTTKFEFVYRAWAACLKQKSQMIRNPVIVNCIRLNPSAIWKLCLSSLSPDLIWPIITHIDLDPKCLDVIRLNSFLKAALIADPSGNSALEIQDQFGKEKHKNEEYITILSEMAAAQLLSPNGDLHFAIDHFYKHDPTNLLKKFPSQERLYALLRLNCSEWVIRILESSSSADLSKLSHEFFIRLAMHLKGNPEMRARVLLHPPVEAEFLTSYWEEIIESQCLDTILQGKLLILHNHYQMGEEKTAELANRLLDRARITRTEVGPNLSSFLYDILPRISKLRAHAIWNALRQTLKVSKSELFKAAMLLWKQEPLPEGTLLWITDTLNKERLKAFEETLVNLPSELVPASQLERYILPSLLRIESWDCYWHFIKNRPELQMPIPSQNVPYNPVIFERIQGILCNPSYETLILAAALELHYHLGLGNVIYSKLIALSKDKIIDPLYTTVLLLSLRPSKESEANLIIQQMGCGMSLELSPLHVLMPRPEIRVGLVSLIEASQDCHSRRHFLVSLALEKNQKQNKVSASDVVELANLMHRYYALAVPGKQIHVFSESPIQILYALILQLPENEKMNPCKALLDTGLAMPPNVADYHRIRELLLKYTLDNDGTLLAFQFLINSLLMLGEKYNIDEKDRVILDHHGHKIKREGSVPIEVQRLMCEALEISDRFSTQKKGAERIMVRPRLGLGLWDNISFEAKNSFWIRSARLFVDTQIEQAKKNTNQGVRADNIEMLAFWLKDLLHYIPSQWHEDEVLALCGKVRLEWLHVSGEYNVIKKLSQFLIVVPTEKITKKAVLEACKDFLDNFPHHIGDLLDTLFEKNWFNIQDSDSINEIILLIHQTLKNNGQRPGIREDWEQIVLLNLLNDQMKLPLTDHAEHLILLRTSDKWQIEQLLSAWKACIDQNAHRYALYVLSKITEKFLQGSVIENINSIPELLKLIKTCAHEEELIPRLIEASLPYLRKFDFTENNTLIRALVKPEMLGYYVASMLDAHSSPKECHKIVAAMPQWTKTRCYRNKDSYCGPLGPINDKGMRNVTDTFSHIVIVFSNAPNIDTCRQCLGTLSEAIRENTITPARYKSLLQYLLNLSKKSLNLRSSPELLTEILNFLQALISFVNPYYVSEEILLNFSTLAAAEGNLERLNCINCTLIKEHPVYRFLTDETKRSTGNIKETQSHLQKLINLKEGRKAVELWKRLDDQGHLDGWNGHWNLFFLAEDSNPTARQKLAEVCSLMPLKNEEIEIWNQKAPTLIPKIDNRVLKKKLLQIFVDMQIPVPSPLIPLFITLCHPTDLRNIEVQMAFRGNSWIDFYPHLVNRYVNFTVGGNSLNCLWEGWFRYKQCGGDPDANGITQRIIDQSLLRAILIKGTIYNQILCSVYRERKGILYGHLPFLFLNGPNFHIFDAWEQLTQENDVVVQGLAFKGNYSRLNNIAMLVEEYGCRGLQLVNISRKKGWIDLPSCENILVSLNTKSRKFPNFLDFLIEMANDPNRQAQAERLTLDLKELLVAICEKGSLQTLNALSFLNKICRDRADPIQAHSIYKHFSDVIAIFLPSIIKEDPDASIVDESLFIASQILTRRLTQCVFGNTLSDVRLWSYLGGTWDFVKTFYSNRNIVVLLNTINLRRADQTSSIENVALRTQMLWQGLIGGASDLTAAIGMGNVLDKWTEKIVMRPNLDKKKAAHLIVAWGSLLDWMRRIHKLGDSAQFIECWRKAIQTCIANRLKKEKKQALLGNALSIIADYIIVEKDNLEDIILCLRNLSKGTNEMVGIVGELKAVMVEHLKRVGNEDQLKYFVRKT